MEIWMIWIAIGILCLIIEIFTPGFLFMSFGIGAILTGLTATFISNITVQIVIFTIITFILFINLRKLSKKLIPESSEKTNVSALIDKIGVVTKFIPEFGRGYVKVDGEEWSAISKLLLFVDPLHLSFNYRQNFPFLFIAVSSAVSVPSS